MAFAADDSGTPSLSAPVPPCGNDGQRYRDGLPHLGFYGNGMFYTSRRPRILLGITGSVAAVKGPKLALRLAREVKADVKVVLTRTVEQFFWKEGRAVPMYDVDSWRDFSASISSVAKETDGENDDWRSSEGRISLHCTCYRSCCQLFRSHQSYNISSGPIP